MNLTITIIWIVIRMALSVSLLGLSTVSFINTYTAFTKEKRAILTVDSSLPVSNGYGLTKSYPVVILQAPNTPPRSLSVSGLFWDEQYKAGTIYWFVTTPMFPLEFESIPGSVMALFGCFLW